MMATALYVLASRGLRVAGGLCMAVLPWLQGCGGSDPATGRLDAAVAHCEVREGSDRCTIQLSWTTRGARALQLQAPDGTPAVQVAAEGTATVGVTISGGQATLIDDGVMLASISLSATCAARSEPGAAGVCRPAVRHYTEKVYTLFYGYPFVVGADRARMVDNRSGLPLAEYAANCRLAVAPAASGRIPVACTEALDGTGPWHRLYIDPLDDSLQADPDSSPVPPAELPPVVFGRPAIPAALSAFVAHGTYYDKGSQLLQGPYVTFGSLAGDPGRPFCSDYYPTCYTMTVPYDFYDFIGESGRAYYLRSSLEGGLYLVTKEAPGPGPGTVPTRLPKDGYQGIGCRTCTSPSPGPLLAYTHPG